MYPSLARVARETVSRAGHCRNGVKYDVPKARRSGIPPLTYVDRIDCDVGVHGTARTDPNRPGGFTHAVISRLRENPVCMMTTKANHGLRPRPMIAVRLLEFRRSASVA